MLSFGVHHLDDVVFACGVPFAWITPENENSTSRAKQKMSGTRSSKSQNASQASARDARVHGRSRSCALIRLGSAKASLAARLVDVSPSGLQCKIANGLIPRVGEPVLIEWPDASTSFATLKWIKQQRVGLQLDYLTADFGDRLDTASLGLESYSRLVQFQTIASE